VRKPLAASGSDTEIRLATSAPTPKSSGFEISLRLRLRLRRPPPGAAAEASFRMSSKPPKSRRPPPPPARPRRLARVKPSGRSESFELASGPKRRRRRPLAPPPKPHRQNPGSAACLRHRSRRDRNALRLSFVGEQLIGGIQLGKARRRLRSFLLASGCNFFGKLTVGALDVARACLPIDAQDLIGITHPCRTPSSILGPAPPAPLVPSDYNVGIIALSRNAISESARTFER